MHRVIAAGTCVCTSICLVKSEYTLTFDKRDRSTHKLKQPATNSRFALFYLYFCISKKRDTNIYSSMQKEEDGQPTARTLDRRVEVNREACLMTT